MQHPIIIEGRAFDWQAGNEAARHLFHDDGEPNWRAAFSADPGVMSCPFCDTSMWDEGTRVECPVCHQEFRTNWRDVARRATGKDPLTHRLTNETNARLVELLHRVTDAVAAGEPFHLPPGATPPLVRDFARAARESLMDPSAQPPRQVVPEAVMDALREANRLQAALERIAELEAQLGRAEDRR
jgi:hypothetical protein